MSGRLTDYDLIVVGPNGALDSYYHLASLEIAAVNRAIRVFHTAGGKGHNLARAANRLGARVLSIGLAGGDSGRFMQHELEREGVIHDLVWVDAETRRCNTLYSELEQDTTVILEPGPPVGSAACNALSDCVVGHAHEAPYVVLTGSLPPDFPYSYFATLTTTIKRQEAGIRVCIDSTGETLRLAAAAGPWLIKVNRHEFCQAFGKPGCELSHSFAAGRYQQLQEWGVEVLIITDGSDGAWVFGPDQAPFRVRTRVESWVSTAGAGDTLMAALLVALNRGDTLREAVRFASAAAAANLQQLGCGFFDPADVDRFLAETVVWDWGER